ncbi:MULTISPECIES: hypothetical protein [unclassified Arsukibacterium]|uniref:hypothetical protein n=1 Tax=unclassified Arsukibacterium TaxID=2635278 RepID=UPI000C65095A|nr:MULTISPECIES: hypothetical protein [unclassified Arsukibacterium]MAA96553.1 hypothetical protein [Rheinheimera sp.]MBM33227.1 hypothetical protein [Rheinheimera sp.]HAW91711.1 hypothetical protein [Candidatus Azambacteria bacterium]|tara:strand:- start:405 stop:788 length:384 start_codon:yes stop_codon:yes gene_type:complete
MTAYNKAGPDKGGPDFERREGPDLLRRAFKYVAIIAWLLFFAALVVSHYARPEMDSGLVRYLGLDIRDYWRPRLTFWLVYLLWGSVVVSMVSLVLNRMRLKRRSDHLHFNIILLLLSASGMLFYILR